MSLQRRLLLYLLLCAPLVWAAGLAITVNRARHEINELYDTQIIRLARQVQATLPAAALEQASPAGRSSMPRKGAAGAGEADLRDLAVAVWDARGQLAIADREGVQIPHLPQATGFVDENVEGQPWRIYYLQSFDGAWLVAAGQKSRERSDLVWGLTVSQLIPWLLVLPILLVVMAWAVRQALAPLYQLTRELSGRRADDLRPVTAAGAPQELQPLVAAMNGLFGRIDGVLARERRFTADAAHELRTPLATLRAQWDVVRGSRGEAERRAAEARLDAGMDRMDRLVTQMLALSRVESLSELPQVAVVEWKPIVEQIMNDCFVLAERRRIELACEWPMDGSSPWRLEGSAPLLTVLLRNLLDNGVRYAPEGSTVVVRISTDSVDVENGGPPLTAAQVAVIGERFARADGQKEVGSGLGISIAQRIAELHLLSLTFGTATDDGQGVRVRLRPAVAASAQ